MAYKVSHLLILPSYTVPLSICANLNCQHSSANQIAGVNLLSPTTAHDL